MYFMTQKLESPGWTSRYRLTTVSLLPGDDLSLEGKDAGWPRAVTCEEAIEISLVDLSLASRQVFQESGGTSTAW